MASQIDLPGLTAYRIQEALADFPAIIPAAGGELLHRLPCRLITYLRMAGILLNGIIAPQIAVRSEKRDLLPRKLRKPVQQLFFA